MRLLGPHRRSWFSILAATAAIALPTLLAHGDTPATTPATQPGGMEVANRELFISVDAFNKVFGSGKMLTNAADREAAADRLITAGRRVNAAYRAVAAHTPAGEMVMQAMTSQMTNMLALFGDEEAAAQIQAEADSQDPAIVARGKASQLTVRWWRAAGDATAQAKIVDDAETIAKQYPTSDAMAFAIYGMITIGAPDVELTDRLQSIVADTLKGPAAASVLEGLRVNDKLNALPGRPLALSATLVDGKPFTTADWKGKVVVVDFWATWCTPCVAEIPRLQKLYEENHAKGLEIVGISNDYEVDKLTKFVESKKVPWPQIFDTKAAEAQQPHPLTREYGIIAIPALFVIDKNGVCRSINARDELETLIPKLLAE